MAVHCTASRERVLHGHRAQKKIYKERVVPLPNQPSYYCQKLLKILLDSTFRHKLIYYASSLPYLGRCPSNHVRNTSPGCQASQQWDHSTELQRHTQLPRSKLHTLLQPQFHLRKPRSPSRLRQPLCRNHHHRIPQIRVSKATRKRRHHLQSRRARRLADGDHAPEDRVADHGPGRRV